MQTVASRIFDELEVHTKIEEDVFYPAVRDVSDEVRDLVVDGLEEHGVANGLIEGARRTAPTDEHWAAKVTVLIESVEHHAGEEEEEMFGLLRAAMGSDDLEALGDRLE